MNQNQSGGKKAALIIGCIFIGFMLVVSLFISVVQMTYQFVSFVERAEADSDSDEWPDENDLISEKDLEAEAETENEGENVPSVDDEYWEGVEYYQFTDYLREDLTYEVKFEREEQSKADEHVFVDINYPVVSGENVINLDGINGAIQDEIASVHEYVEGIEEAMYDDDTFHYIVDGYVTYMSEEILSIAFIEYGYLNEEYIESYVICLNFDMVTGMVMDNTQILDIDDEFSIDFRERSDKQNGEIESLSVYSDQEITEHFNDDIYAIILYTPLGMEVGFNYYDGWVTVTYKDYQQFLRQL